MAELFHTTTAGPVQVVHLELPDALDSDDFDRLNESLLAELGKSPGGAWVLDLSMMHYAGSPLLGLMINVRQRVKQSGGRLVLSGLSDTLTQIFQTCSLERLFVIRRSTAEAIERAR
jgi:anti-anti-sigma factor